MKVVHIIENLLSGGRERRLIEFLKGCSGRNIIENHLIILSDEIFFTEIKNIPHTIISRKELSEPMVLKKIYSFCKEYDPDIIHAWGELAACHASVVKFLLRKKLVNGMVSSAGDKITLKRKIYAGFSFLFSDIILSNSKAGLASFDVPHKKARIVYNGFNGKRLENLTPKDILVKRLGIHEGFIVGMVANFTAHKDYDTYLEAAKYILSKRQDITFLCVGEGWNMGIKQTRGMEDYKREYACENIIFTGMQKDIESISNILDIGVLISHGEAISNSILEYMALGKPVIATNKGGTPELVENGNNGFLIGYKNVEELAEKIEFLLDDEDLRRKMGERSKQIIAEKFSINGMVNGIIEIYRSLLK